MEYEKVFRVEADEHKPSSRLIRDLLLEHYRWDKKYDCKVREIYFLTDDERVEKQLKDSGHL